MKITYETTSKFGKPLTIAVRLGRKRVGTIKGTPGAYFYEARGGLKGETFNTVGEVRASLEGGDDAQ